jgi:hypothetical protein
MVGAGAGSMLQLQDAHVDAHAAYLLACFLRSSSALKSSNLMKFDS